MALPYRRDSEGDQNANHSAKADVLDDRATQFRMACVTSAATIPPTNGIESVSQCVDTKLLNDGFISQHSEFHQSQTGRYTVQYRRLKFSGRRPE
jgi:hypothetical protein